MANNLEYTTPKQGENLAIGIVNASKEGSVLHGATAGLNPDSETYSEDVFRVLQANITEDDFKNEFVKGICNTLTESYLVAQDKFTTVMSKFNVDSTGKFGGFVREIYIELPKSQEFKYSDPENENVFKRAETVAHEELHFINKKIVLQITISDDELNRAVSSPGEFAGFINGFKEGLVLEASKLEEGYLREIFQKVFVEPTLTKVTVNGKDRAEKSQDILRAVENYSFYMTRENKFSLIGKEKFTSKDQQVVVIKKEALTDIRITQLAKAFNMNQVDFDNQLLIIDNFGEGLEDVEAILLDRKAIIYETRTNKLKMIENPKGLYTNMFYHKQDIASVSKFRPIVYIVSEPEAVEPEVPAEPEA